MGLSAKNSFYKRMSVVIRGKTMNLPEIGDIITTKKALKLCRYFSLDYPI